MADDGAECRYCFASEGPGGLQDLLVEPCACSGSAAHAHVR